MTRQRIFPKWVWWALIGAVVGAALGFVGVKRAQSHSLQSATNIGSIWSTVIASSAGGALSGLVLWGFRPLRKRGRGERSLAWVLAMYVGFGVLLAPDLLGGVESWRVVLVLWLFGGVGLGLSIALVEEWLRTTLDQTGSD